MTSKPVFTVKNKVVTSNDVRIVLMIVTLIMFLLGAGAPSDGGGIAGF